MAAVILEGQYLGSSIRTSSYDGKERKSLAIDLYQPASPSADKSVTVKSDDLELIQFFSGLGMGEHLKLRCQVNAYRNTAYFKLLEVSE